MRNTTLAYVMLIAIAMGAGVASAQNRPSCSGIGRQGCPPPMLCWEGSCGQPKAGVPLEYCQQNADCTGYAPCNHSVGQQAICPPMCVGGVCAEPCNADYQCPPQEACGSGICLALEGNCRDDNGCDDQQACEHGWCEDLECTQNSHCGDRQICTDNACVTVECTRATHCSSNQFLCKNNHCVDRCPRGRDWVEAKGVLPVCGACVPEKRRRTCRSPKDCPIDKLCAGGTCIDRCDKRRLPRRPEKLEDPRRFEAVPGIQPHAPGQIDPVEVDPGAPRHRRVPAPADESGGATRNPGR